ncbi:MAG: alpha/beta hydrolase [Clostridiales bacterium]|nr:alpha/beta hydrolase [Clostridiales bacterium]
MKSEIRFKKTAVLLLAAALVCTVLAAFLPYALEPLLGIAAACIAIHTVYLGYEKFINPFWLTLAAMAVSAVSVVLTLVLILGHQLGLYTLIQALNLIVIGLSAFILLHKKWAYRAAICAIAAICLVFAAFGAFSHIAYGRTVMATVAEWFLASNKVADEKVESSFQALTEAGETSYTVNPKAFDRKLTEENYEGMPVLTINADGKRDRVLFYIHGGYYVHQMNAEHTTAINRLVNATGAMAVVPIYPLAPFNTAEDSQETMLGLFEQVRADNPDSKIILMGDSAGGGYALALAEILAERGLDQPDELILLSPWVDVTMSNPEIKDYESVDPMLTVTMGRVSGEAWAGELPTDDWHVSPIYGDLSKLQNVTIFVGDRELFTPDDTLLYEKLSANENTRLVVGHGQNHVYPVYPTLEGRIAMEQIMGIIER